MHAGKTVFSQVIARVPHWEFERLAQVHDLADGRRQFSAWDHLLALAFAQMTFRESLRDIEACLGTPHLAYQLGFRSRVTRTTLARANESRDWRLFSALAHKLIVRARRLYQDEPGYLDLDVPVYAVDSTLIELSLALCPWANWTGRDAAVKLHTALDLRGPLPAVLSVTAASHSDVTWLDALPIEPGSIYLMDRGYIDFRRLRRIALAGAFFVIRDRSDVRSYVAASRPVDRSSTLRSDQSIRFCSRHSRGGWPDLMRRVSIFDSAQSMRLAFWTNQWSLPAAVIAELYRSRWQIELFFRWVKQSLRLRSFYGTSENAVRVQLWSAICIYLATAITRKELKLSVNLTTLVQVLSLHALSKVPIEELFAKLDTSKPPFDIVGQLTLNDL
jgi:hypothetical protein